MKRILLGISAGLLSLALVACAQETAPPAPATEAAPDTPTAPTASPAPDPTVAPTPKPTATERPAAVGIETASELNGVWEGSLAGERGYFLFRDDGTYVLSLSEAGLQSDPRVAGEYWLEDGRFHMRDLTNAGHWTECDAEQIGVYTTAVSDNGILTFAAEDDGCDSGGFTRNYVMTNAKFKRIGD